MLVANGHDERSVVHEYSYSKILMYVEAIVLNKNDALRDSFFNIRVAMNGDQKSSKEYLDSLDGKRKRSSGGKNEDELREAAIKRLQAKVKKEKK